jgi:uncharacterized PurR-regulated membrane protein YhhQ (DUF165 family)
VTGDLTRPPAWAGTEAPNPGLSRYHREILLFLQGLLLLATSALALAVCVWAWTLTASPFVWFDGVLSPDGVEALRPSRWLTWGHAAICVLFLLTSLVCRRYGVGAALVHLLLSVIWVVGAATAMSLEFVDVNPGAVLQPSVREAVALLLALTAGQVASVYVFEHTRGVEWWNAPAYAALTATLVSMPLFYAIAYAGEDWIWLNRMSIDVALKALMAFALLVPYFVLRPFVRPREGMGGY